MHTGHTKLIYINTTPHTNQQSMPRARITTGITHPRQNGRNFTVNRKRLAELRRLQKSEKSTTSKAAFARITREIMDGYKHGLRLKSDTVDAIQTASEDYLHKLFKKAAVLAAHAGRTTITRDDLDLVKTLDEIEHNG